MITVHCCHVIAGKTPGQLCDCADPCYCKCLQLCPCAHHTLQRFTQHTRNNQLNGDTQLKHNSVAANAAADPAPVIHPIEQATYAYDYSAAGARCDVDGVDGVASVHAGAGSNTGVYYGVADTVSYEPGDCPIVLSVPHGGYVTCNSLICNRAQGCFEHDLKTQELAHAIKHALYSKYGNTRATVTPHAFA